MSQPKKNIARKAEVGRDAAVDTLQRMGYTYHGGELWKPPLGGALRPVVVHNGPVGPDKCPFTGGKFWGNIDHPELGLVATYGGPFDTYTIPALCEDNEVRCERYDQDAGHWVEGGQPYGWFYLEQQAGPASATAVNYQHLDLLASAANALRGVIEVAHTQKVRVTPLTAKILEDIETALREAKCVANGVITWPTAVGASGTRHHTGGGQARGMTTPVLCPLCAKDGECKKRMALCNANPGEFGTPPPTQFQASGESDELYLLALEKVRETGRGSISILQRDLKIGYHRAACMLEAMERDGLITPWGPNGTGRDVVPVVDRKKPDDTEGGAL